MFTGQLHAQKLIQIAYDSAETAILRRT